MEQRPACSGSFDSAAREPGKHCWFCPSAGGGKRRRGGGWRWWSLPLFKRKEPEKASLTSQMPVAILLSCLASRREQTRTRAKSTVVVPSEATANHGPEARGGGGGRAGGPPLAKRAEPRRIELREAQEMDRRGRAHTHTHTHTHEERERESPLRAVREAWIQSVCARRDGCKRGQAEAAELDLFFLLLLLLPLFGCLRSSLFLQDKKREREREKGTLFKIRCG